MDRGLLRAGLERMFEGGLEIFPRFLEEVPNPPRYLLGIPVVLARSRLENHLDPKTVSGLYRPERVAGFLHELAPLQGEEAHVDFLRCHTAAGDRDLRLGVLSVRGVGDLGQEPTKSSDRTPGGGLIPIHPLELVEIAQADEVLRLIHALVARMEAQESLILHPGLFVMLLFEIGPGDPEADLGNDGAVRKLGNEEAEHLPGLLVPPPHKLEIGPPEEGLLVQGSSLRVTLAGTGAQEERRDQQNEESCPSSQARDHTMPPRKGVTQSSQSYWTRRGVSRKKGEINRTRRAPGLVTPIRPSSCGTGGWDDSAPRSPLAR